MSDVSTVATTSHQLEALLAEVRTILSLDALDADTPLIDLGVDSISIVEIMLACEAIYQNSGLSGNLIVDQYTTIRDIDDQIAGQFQ